MKMLRVGGYLGLLIGMLVVSYYFGRPFYGDMQQTLVAVSSSVQQDTDHASNQTLLTNTASNSSAKDVSEHKQQTGSTSSRDSLEEESVKTGKMQTLANDNTSGNDNTSAVSRESQESTRKTSHPLHEDLRRAIWDPPPRESKMPPLEEFSLRKEMVEFRAKKNVIAVTFANHAFMGFVRSWVKSLTDDGVANLLVGAMDTKLLEALYWEGIPTFDMGSHMKTFDVGWGTPTFHKMGREKVILVNSFLSLGYELLMCDTDMVWLRNPLPYIEQYPEADVLTSSDEVVNTVDDESLENFEKSFGAYNIGINHWRPTAVAKRFAAEWKQLLLSDDNIWDQNGFNEIMRKTSGPAVNNSTGLFYSYDGQLKLGILPVSIFCSGHTFFVQELYKALGLQPYAIHTTFQFAGTDGKRHRLREAKVFYDSPDYYDVPGGYLSYIPSLPENLMRGGAHSVQTHFNLVNHQLVQVRSALAIASTLNRTLVMPELWCRFDRMWFGHPGILPGTHTKQPFLCPMDHIFEINTWLDDLAEEDFGPAIRFREYSFFENPRLPSKVQASILKVTLCEKGTPECNAQPAKDVMPEAIQLPINSTADELKAVLSSYGDTEVIEFSSMVGAFGGFSDKKSEALFMKRVKLYTGIWCCVVGVTPGHIWYDIYWDTKPGWKPRPPLSPQDDHQPW